ncbi:DUF2493 domain-containing protein [Pseudactinotalea sp. Z1732]|uniref:DUF2493 domain-containing protein n=1 Tax=Micrococcales TaxID=85006 RepID=UPI003C7D0F4F
MRILVTGSRNWTDTHTLQAALDEALTQADDLAEVVLVHGDCPTGADRMAARYFDRLGLATEAHPADWGAHGRAAGPIRNAHMVSLGADLVLAFPLGASRGTWNCTRLAQRAGIPVRIITSSTERT